YVRWTENRNMEEFLRLAATGQLQLEPLVTHRFALEDAARAYETIMNPAASSLAVLLRYPASDAASNNGDATSSDGDAASPSFTPRRRVEVSGAPRATTTRRAPHDLRVALVGAGNIARWAHVPALKKFPGARLEAVYSASGARGKSYARRFGASYCASDYEEILRDEHVDVVLVATRNQHHAAQSLAALEAGKHVFVEKPMALTLEECRALTRAVAAGGKQLTVGFNRRFAPFYRELKKELARRAGPAVLNCRVNSPGISGSYWMADPAIGGAILGEAVHFVDLLYWLLDSEPVSVFAQSLPTGKEHPVGENNVAAAFRFADGSVASLTYCTVGSQTSAGERVEAFAEGLGVSTENFKRLDLCKGTARTRSRWWGDKGYDEQLASFLAALGEGREPEVTVADGARATLGCLAILESARTGAPREIDLETMKDERGTMN
ncbi:MAG: Gfo/Idh/MocA family oxidoreductase, partial [Acidobacteria bacterium]|nr:Gfo/Idh/MocA family oxidoreductase [Acidobacteriota bacterium]